MHISDWITKLESAIGRTAESINAMSRGRLLGYLIALFAVWRFLTLGFMEKSGDAVWKWSFLRYYSIFGQWYPLTPDHHQGRWALNMPVLGLMKLFGDSPWVYYIYPLLTALGAGILIFLITSELRSKAAGVAAFVLFLLFPLTVRESIQFLPMLPAAFYALAAAWLLLRHQKSAALLPVFFSGLLVGISYGCKFTSLYWGAAFLLSLSLWPSEKKEYFRVWKFHFGPAVLLFSLGLLLVLATETLLLNHFFGVSFGRAEVIMGSHLSNRPDPQYKTLVEYLLSFIRPLDFRGKYFETVPPAMLFIVSLPLAVFWCVKGARPQRFVAFSFLVVWFLHCYMVYKVFPFLHPERPHSRYFLVLAVFGMIITAGSWKSAGEFLKERFPARKNLIPALQMAFIAAILTLMLIRAGNLFSHGDWIYPVIQGNRNFAAARAGDLPVYSRVRDKEEFIAGKMSSRDFKYGELWSTFYGPASTLPEYGKEFHPALDESGRCWIRLFGPAPDGDAPARVLLLDETESEFKTMTLTPLPVQRPEADKSDDE